MAEPAPPTMTSQRPYLLRALYEWVADNGMTPHVLVDARMPGVKVPAHAVQDGRIVLNIADRAVGRLDMGNDALRFSARFGGVSQNVVVPLDAIIAIYARETGQGMSLPEEPGHDATPDDAADGIAGASIESGQPQPPPDEPTPTPPPARGAHLRIVK